MTRLRGALLLALLQASVALAGSPAEPDPAQPPSMPAKLPNLLHKIKSQPAPSWEVSPSDFGLTGENKLSDTLMSRLRVSIPPTTPEYIIDPSKPVPGYQLYIVEHTGSEFLTFWRNNPAGGHSPDRSSFLIRFLSNEGAETARLALNDLLAQPACEIQDVRFRDGVIYWNEACPSYSAGLHGRCSTLTAYRIADRRVIWRTPWLVSNNIFIFFDDDTILTGYGFTDEKDYLYLVDTHTGKLKSRTPIRTAHEYLEIRDGKLHVLTYDTYYVFRLPGVP